MSKFNWNVGIERNSIPPYFTINYFNSSSSVYVLSFFGIYTLYYTKVVWTCYPYFQHYNHRYHPCPWRPDLLYCECEVIIALFYIRYNNNNNQLLKCRSIRKFYEVRVGNFPFPIPLCYFLNYISSKLFASWRSVGFGF